RRLTAFSRMLIFDKRGQGLCDRPGRPPTLEESMDDLKAVVEASGFERPALLGVSEGGPMSALYAATYPDQVSSLVLIGTFARIPGAWRHYLAQAIPGARYVELPRQERRPFTGDLDALLDEVEECLVGSRGAGGSERALATMLFTDTVGSTERAAELGDRGWR